MNDAPIFEASQSDDSRYRLLVDAITDYAIYMLDLEGRVTSWNPGAERFKGYTAEAPTPAARQIVILAVDDDPLS